MAFDIHVFLDREGKVCAAVTDSDCVRSKPVRLTAASALVMFRIMQGMCEMSRIDSKVEDSKVEGVE